MYSKTISTILFSFSLILFMSVTSCESKTQNESDASATEQTDSHNSDSTSVGCQKGSKSCKKKCSGDKSCNVKCDSTCTQECDGICGKDCSKCDEPCQKACAEKRARLPSRPGHSRPAHPGVFGVRAALDSGCNRTFTQSCEKPGHHTQQG